MRASKSLSSNTREKEVLACFVFMFEDLNGSLAPKLTLTDAGQEREEQKSEREEQKREIFFMNRNIVKKRTKQSQRVIKIPPYICEIMFVYLLSLEKLHFFFFCFCLDLCLGTLNLQGIF